MTKVCLPAAPEEKFQIPERRVRGSSGGGWHVNGAAGLQVFHALTEAKANKPTFKRFNVSGSRTKARDTHA